MGIAIFSILGISSFLIGIFLVYRGMASAPDADTTVDHAEYDQVCQQYAQLQQEAQELKQRSNALAVELETSKVQSQETERFRREVDSLKRGDQEAQKKIRWLEESLQFLSRKADQQAQKAIAVIHQLKSGRQSLRDELTAQKSAVSLEDFQSLEKKEADLQAQLQESRNQWERLEQESKLARDTVEAQLEESRESVAKLQSDNQIYEQGIQQIMAKCSAVAEAFQRVQREKTNQLQNARILIERLRRDYEDLQSQQAAEGVQDDYEQELTRFRSESEGRLSEAHETIGRFQEEIRILQKELEEARQASGVLQRRIDEISGQEFQEGSKVMHDREKELTELRETNQFLRQKERLLSQELLRSQTQALGLEKICQEFKKQVERR